MFGYPRAELVGENLSRLIPELDQDQRNGSLDYYSASEEARASGLGREVVGQRRDGGCFPLEIAVSEMWLGGSTTKRWSDYVTTSTWTLKSDYEAAKYKCLRMNRDNDGDGTIDENEVQWYLAAINQLTDLWIGEWSFDQRARLYRKTTWTEGQEQYFASSTVTMPGALSKLAEEAAPAAPIEPVVMETPAPVADLASLDFDLGFGDEQSVATTQEKKADEASVQESAPDLDQGPLDFDLGSGSDAVEAVPPVADELPAGAIDLDFNFPEMEESAQAAERLRG